jgi:Bax protein
VRVRVIVTKFTATKTRFEIGSLGLLSVSVVALYAAVFAAPMVAAPADAADAPTVSGLLFAPDPTLIQVADAASLSKKFSDLGYHLPGVRTEGDVPRIQVVNLPSDLVTIQPVAERKSLFILAMLPLVLHANEAILEERGKLLALAPKPLNSWAAQDRNWLGELALKYNAEDLEGRQLIDELIRRIDIVPASLAVAQAAEESGWGTSRFAIEGNAIFGQWTTSEANGLRPGGAEEEFKYFVRAFDGLGLSVAAYMQNLNSHAAYVSFRNRRKMQRDQVGELDSIGLAKTLLSYSERGSDYVVAIRTIMESNQLMEYDQARLRLDTPTNPNI